jgi:hypothetical protein
MMDVLGSVKVSQRGAMIAQMSCGITATLNTVCVPIDSFSKALQAFEICPVQF